MLELFRFIDWIMVLPADLEQSFRTEIEQHEERQKMRYVTSVERLARQNGIEEGIELGALETARESILDVLTLRFKTIPQSLVGTI